MPRKYEMIGWWRRRLDCRNHTNPTKRIPKKRKNCKEPIPARTFVLLVCRRRGLKCCWCHRTNGTTTTHHQNGQNKQREWERTSYLGRGAVWYYEYSTGIPHPVMTMILHSSPTIKSSTLWRCETEWMSQVCLMTILFMARRSVSIHPLARLHINYKSYFK